MPFLHIVTHLWVRVTTIVPVEFHVPRFSALQYLASRPLRSPNGSCWCGSSNDCSISPRHATLPAARTRSTHHPGAVIGWDETAFALVMSMRLIIIHRPPTTCGVQGILYNYFPVDELGTSVVGWGVECRIACLTFLCVDDTLCTV